MPDFPNITAMTTAALVILQVVLAMRTSMGRIQHKQSLGDGGHADMIARSRAHGNFTENAPIILLMIGLLEISGASTVGIALLALVFFAGRILHPIGMAMKNTSNIPRMLGAMSANLVGFIGGAWLLLVATNII